MTLEAFIEQASLECAKYIDDKEYIKALRPDMEREYRNSFKTIPILGYQQISPSGYAFGINMLYPDMPPNYE